MIAECSTISPSESRALAAAFKAKGVDFLDAPVTGSTPRSVPRGRTPRVEPRNGSERARLNGRADGSHHTRDEHIIEREVLDDLPPAKSEQLSRQSGGLIAGFENLFGV